MTGRPPFRWLQPPPLPHEHGAWAMLTIPLVLGLSAAWPPGAASALLAAAMVLLFFSRYAALPAALRLAAGRTPPEGFVRRRFLWAAIDLAGSLACFAAALRLASPAARPATFAAALATVVLGGAHTALAFADRDRTWWGEIIGMAGLASAAPLLQAAAGRPLDGRAVGVGLLALAYFVSSLAWVRAFRTIGKGNGGAAAGCIAAHVAVALGVVVLWRLGWIPALAAAAMLPPLARTAWGLRSPPRNLLVLGWREVTVATLFGAIAIAALVF